MTSTWYNLLKLYNRLPKTRKSDNEDHYVLQAVQYPWKAPEPYRAQCISKVHIWSKKLNALATAILKNQLKLAVFFADSSERTQKELGWAITEADWQSIWEVQCINLSLSVTFPILIVPFTTVRWLWYFCRIVMIARSTTPLHRINRRKWVKGSMIHSERLCNNLWE